MELDEVAELLARAKKLNLKNNEILDKYTLEQLSKICNGIGAESFPAWLRSVISSLHPSLAVVAFIHDVEWYECDATKKTFTESNDRFKENGYIVAKDEYGWYNPLRYIVMNQARRFGNVCQWFGWENYLEGGKDVL